MKITAKCGHEVEITEEELHIDGIIEYKKNFECDECSRILASKETPQKLSIRDVMSTISMKNENAGLKWNPIRKTWEK